MASRRSNFVLEGETACYIYLNPFIRRQFTEVRKFTRVNQHTLVKVMQSVQTRFTHSKQILNLSLKKDEPLQTRCRLTFFLNL